MKRVFISYAEEDRFYKEELIKHLSSLIQLGKINIWHKDILIVGSIWDKEIRKNIKKSDISLFMISSYSLASEYIKNVELAIALSRYNKNKQLIIPIITRPCDWEYPPLSNFQALPERIKALSLWDDLDEALVNVVKGLSKVL
ncbi:MAG: toll/interleukin-1 receptor domain-containing protein [Aureispira sp.]